MLTMTLKAFTERFAKDTAFRQRFATAVSPGYAGGKLGITRQGVHKALATGHLDGVRLVGSGDTLAVLVFLDTLESRLRKTA